MSQLVFNKFGSIFVKADKAYVIQITIAAVIKSSSNSLTI